MTDSKILKYSSITKRDYTAVAGPDWPSYDQFLTHQDVPEFVYNEIDEMLSGPRAFDNTAFCVLPFYSIELPAKTACCLLPDNADVESIKRQMLNNQRPVECSKCWKLEDADIKSDRMLKNETLDYYFDQDLISIFEDCVDQKNYIQHYKIDTSNVCNATCITCGSGSSSAWGQLQKKHHLPALKNWSISPTQLQDQINYQTAKSIIFRGGEPFLSSTNFHVLEQLLEHNNSDCFISFVTNGSITLTEYQKNLISQFKNKNFCFSIDGVGPVFEYMRYPLKWSALEKNIQYCRDNDILISVSYTISNVNVMYHDQTVEWFRQNQLRFINNPVYTPLHFQPSALPAEIKKHIAGSMKDTQVASALLQQHSDQDEQNYQQFRIAISQQNQLKGIQMKDYLPELAELLDL
jgi:organic radical activating enzyme